jgi:hypothetical protein
VRQKISAHIDGELSGGSCVRRPGSEDHHRREWKLQYFMTSSPKYPVRVLASMCFRSWVTQVFPLLQNTSSYNSCAYFVNYSVRNKLIYITSLSNKLHSKNVKKKTEQLFTQVINLTPRNKN